MQTGQRYGFAENDSRGKIFQEYFSTQNAYIFGGHSHLGFSDQDLQNNINIDRSGDITYVHIPATVEIRAYDYATSGSVDVDGQQGWILDIYDGFITFSPIDFKTDTVYTQYALYDGETSIEQAKVYLSKVILQEE